MSRTIVVVPCYNEARRLDLDQFRQFARQHDRVRFLMVNDGSTDETLGLLESLQVTAPDRFTVFDLPRNMGKAEAVRRGFLEAFRSKPDYVAFWDGDLATPLGAIEAFCEALDQRPDVEIVMGTRISLLGRKIDRTPRRRFLGWAFSTAASWVLGVGIRDTQCGAKMFRATAPIQALFQRPFSSRWIFDVEIFARLIRDFAGQGSAAEVIYEMPLAQWREQSGSKLKARDFVKAVFELAVIYWKNLLGLGWRAHMPDAGGPLSPEIVRFPESQHLDSDGDARPADEVRTGPRAGRRDAA